MKNVEYLISQNLVEPLRQGLAKETYRYGDVVIGLVRVDKLDVHDRDPVFMRDSVRKYIDGLISAGVPIVDALEVELQGSNLIMVTKFMPQFLDLAMRANEIKFEDGSLMMLRDIAKTKGTEVGIDPTPKNFAFVHEQTMYADFFYPITREYSNWKKARMVLNTPRRQWIHFAQDYFYFPNVFAHAVCDLAEVGVEPRAHAFHLVLEFCQQNQFGIDLQTLLDKFIETRQQYGQQKR